MFEMVKAVYGESAALFAIIVKHGTVDLKRRGSRLKMRSEMAGQ